MLKLFLNKVGEWPPVWEKAVHWFAVRDSRERLSIWVCASFSISFEDKIRYGVCTYYFLAIAFLFTLTKMTILTYFMQFSKTDLRRKRKSFVLYSLT